MGNQKFYITTSIAYANAPPHVGYALESIQADVVSRYHKNSGGDVFFLTGTDEHGIKVVQAAAKQGKKPQDFVDDISKQYQELKKVLNLSNDDFIRTTDQKRHWPVVQQVWQKLKENGDIGKRKYRGFYCVGCEAFVKEKDLIAGKCGIHQKECDSIEEENWFFKLSKYSDQIKGIIEKDEVKIIPETRKNEMVSFINQGLEDISFSRPKEKLNWGIPVPDDDSQMTYVWLDALVNYISALGGLESDKFKEYWPPDVHCLGKDILRFHATIWLGMLLALKLPLPKSIFVHGFITSEGQKMSKSLGNVVDPFELVKKYGTDAVRYFLLREIPSTEDGDFTEEKFIERYNADLAGGVGNLVARVVTLAGKSEIPDQKSEINAKFEIKINETRENYRKALNEFKFNEALISVWDLIGFCDKIVNEEKPWEGGKEKVIEDLLIVISEIVKLLSPFLPETSEEILKQLKNKKSQPIFPRIS